MSFESLPPELLELITRELIGPDKYGGTGPPLYDIHDEHYFASDYYYSHFSPVYHPRVRRRALKSLRLTCTTFSRMDCIMHALFNTLHVYTIPQTINAALTTDFTPLAPYTTRVIFYGPLFDERMTFEEFEQVVKNEANNHNDIRFAALESTYRTAEAIKEGFERYTRHARDIVDALAGDRFATAWTNLMSPLTGITQLEAVAMGGAYYFQHPMHDHAHLKLEQYYPDMKLRTTMSQYPISVRDAAAVINDEALEQMLRSVGQAKLSPLRLCLRSRLIPADLWTRSPHLKDIFSTIDSLLIVSEAPEKFYQRMTFSDGNWAAIQESLSSLMGVVGPSLKRLRIDTLNGMLIDWPLEPSISCPNLKRIDVKAVRLDVPAFVRELSSYTNLQYLAIRHVAPPEEDEEWMKVFNAIRGHPNHIQTIMEDGFLDYKDFSETTAGLDEYLRGEKEWDQQLENYFGF